MTLKPELDNYNYVRINNPKARQQTLEMIKENNLIDPFRYFNPNTKHYTWRRKNPIKQARLDFFLISDTMLDLVQHSKIVPGYKSDHSIVTLKLLLNKFTRGKGIWKFNCSLLKNIEYLEKINQVIMEEKIKYAIPIYNLEKLHSINDSDFYFTISDKLFLEALLLRIRGETIHFSSILKRKRDRKEENLIKDIDHIEKNVNLLHIRTLLEDKKSELEDIRNEKLKGKMIRSRVQWLDEGERPSKFFCALENRNHINKTLKKLKLTDHNTIFDQKEILCEIHKYYKNLFSSKDDILTDVNLTDIFKNIEYSRLTKDDANKLEDPLNISELSLALSKMKNNKTPGLDGFPADFYKVFWNRIKHFVRRALIESFQTGKLPLSMRQCVITCLPKGDKPREFLKNWRPISLLNVSYKLGSAVIANRIKSKLNDLISNTQTGFLTNRFIGDSTRLVYDLINECNNKKKSGLIMLIDFEKAFDSVSWKFLNNVLKFFNFGPNIQSWIKLLNTDISASVQQSGHLSDFFNIERGCRQGDPISPYLFILCGQILYLMIECNVHIKGITIGQHDFKLTQFADDTSIFLDGSQEALQAALNILEVFGNYSGLRMNRDKTRVVWIGKRRHSKDKLITRPMLQWGDTQFDLLGLRFTVDLNNMIDINYDKYITQSKDIINHWNKRYLTPLGKITVIKTFIISKFIHVASIIPSPKKEKLKDLERMILNFLWDNKPAKVKLKQITQPYQNGGLQMINITSFFQALKISWIRRLLRSSDSPWSKLFDTTICPINQIAEFGPLFAIRLCARISNPFWKEVLKSWIDLCNTSAVESFSNALTQPLWYNSTISKEPLIIRNWNDHGIKIFGDLIKNKYEIMSLPEILNTYGVNNIDFLTMHRIKTAISNCLNTQILLHDMNTIAPLERPYIPFYLRPILKDKKGVRSLNRALNIKENDHVFFNSKWNIDFESQINIQTWKNAYILCFKLINDNYLIWLQYRILNRILGTNYLLYKMKLIDSPLCTLCAQSDETLLHLLWNCQKAQFLWGAIQDWIFNKLHITIELTAEMIILGHLEREMINITH